ncbi:peptidoglycan-binding protein [Paucibacter sp. R3-3]|uniref:Peptidoglycan-binding protein n=1 Tax=Roseateles agri TaxID=3098619 RepID=A0ABU5DCK5_9BURK|nr:peptidoglycan-binding protein [Paucibacter sp. R3-3]MDY0744013.1 peptidoglycan-binding protein [Paucibacter sp. R3-3]
MSLTPTQVRAAQAIVNIFETGSVRGDYGSVTVLSGDTGHLTYGRSQTTLGSGNLNTLLTAYCGNAGARFGARLSPWLPRVEQRDLALDTETKLQNLLRACADDPVMRDTQDSFFDETYWQPAARAAEKLGLTTALGTAVVYDSWVHGSWARIRDLTIAAQGQPAQAGERAWVTAYVAQRKQWLATNANALLRKTVYRMEAFERLIAQDLWGLPLPFVVRGNEIDLTALQATPAGCYDGPQPGTRSLALVSPMARGLDVRLLQLGLSDQGMAVVADGVFGKTSSQLVRDFQTAQGLVATGVADAALVSQLAGLS